MMKRTPTGYVALELTADAFDQLILCMGYAGGAALRDHDRAKFRGFLQLANTVNEGNPNWTPYEIPEEVKS